MWGWGLKTSRGEAQPRARGRILPRRTWSLAMARVRQGATVQAQLPGWQVTTGRPPSRLWTPDGGLGVEEL